MLATVRKTLNKNQKQKTNKNQNKEPNKEAKQKKIFLLFSIYK